MASSIPVPVDFVVEPATWYLNNSILKTVLRHHADPASDPSEVLPGALLAALGITALRRLILDHCANALTLMQNGVSFLASATGTPENGRKC